MNRSEPADELFRIGAVSRLTGIPVDTLRVWERRYGVVKPQRSEGGNRLYTRDDVERLRLIRQLVNRSHAIGTICHLDGQQLRQRLETSLQSEADFGASVTAETWRPIPVALVGSTVGIKLRNALASTFDNVLDVVGEYGDPAAMLEAAGAVSVEAIIIEIDSLRTAEVDLILKVREALSEPQLVVVYGFAPRTAVEPLSSAGVSLARHPVDWAALVNGIRTRMASGQEQGTDEAVGREPPPRLFSDRDLAAISGMSVTLKCECPHHLSELIGSLASFEKYSTQCEQESDEDAHLHTYLRNRSAQARLLMERALQRVIEREGLTVPADD